MSDLQQVALGNPVRRGYPNDFAVAERMLPILATIITEAGMHDFLRDTGRSNDVAIHWRVGDYLENPFHGTYAWSAFDKLLDSLNDDTETIRIFTDSPDYVHKSVKNSDKREQIVIESGDIWNDLYLMTRSRIFIGSHSGISLWAAMALMQGGSQAQVQLPSRWFVQQSSEKHFHPPPETWRKVQKYEADLHV